MRALAEFVMRGRAQAIGVAAVGTATLVFSWVAAAVVALVMLRRGPQEGMVVLGWALLPALALVLFGSDVGPAMALIGAAVAAWILRASVSWPLTLVCAVAIGLLTALLMQTVGSGYVQHLVETFNKLLDQMNSQSGADGVKVAHMTAAQVSGLMGFGALSSTIAALLLARWWQSMLYNPGGFRSEFHRLRLPLPLAAGLIVAGVAVGSCGPDYRFWALMCALPFVVAGFALVHGVAALKRWGRGPLIVLYIAWLLVDWVKAGLLVLALVDSWWDFRGRLASRTPG